MNGEKSHEKIALLSIQKSYILYDSTFMTHPPNTDTPGSHIVQAGLELPM